MANLPQKTLRSKLWMYLGSPILMAWMILGQVVRDVRQQGLWPALHFWGLLIVLSLVMGLVLGLTIVAFRRRPKKDGKSLDRPPQVS